ncbi:MAG: hypothetical protein JXD18_07255 [Anaerolineae bacterium]|nr:hypothetical protein [Anaerolineae bacterium]
MNDERVELWHVEADATLQAILDQADSPALLRQTLTGALAWQVRNETTVARALRAPRIAPQWIAALLALGATVTVEGDGSQAEIPLKKLNGETVSALHVPTGAGRRWGEARVARTPSDEPIVAAFAVVDLDGGIVRQARVALTGAWPEAARLAQAAAQLAGGPLNADRIQSVADGVMAEVAPEGDFLGSADYRREMAGVLTRRALARCLEQGGNK